MQERNQVKNIFLFYAHHNIEAGVHYRLYPEAVSESSNVICTQLDSLIRSIKKFDNLESIVFIMDNHATQKNAICFAYLEWLAKKQVIPKQCIKLLKITFLTLIGHFLCLFLVRGHTHTQLDGSNAKYSQKYFSAPKLTSLQDLVSYFLSGFHKLAQLNQTNQSKIQLQFGIYVAHLQFQSALGTSH